MGRARLGQGPAGGSVLQAHVGPVCVSGPRTAASEGTGVAPPFPREARLGRVGAA